MILTGKAKEDFYKFLTENYPISSKDAEKWFLTLYDDFKYVIIIKFFDNMQYKGVRMYCGFFEYFFKIKLDSFSFNYIVIQTIEACNNFYNSLELNQLPNEM